MNNVKTRKITTRTKKFILTGGMLSVLLFLSGCARFDVDGNPQGAFSEMVYRFLVVPLDGILTAMADFIGNYGVAIIIFTILFRLVLLPFTLKQQKGAIEQQVKMAAVQPVAQEIQAEIKATDDPVEQQALNMELMEVYRANNISLTGQLTGCLPLLLQMPIFIAMLQVLRHSTQISESTLFGMNLGERSIILALLTAAVYFIQSRMMISAMPEEQQKTAGTTMYITPIMMGMIGFSSPAGVSLYWAISGVFSLAQQFFNNYYYKPKIQKQVKEELGDVEVVQRKKKAIKDVTPRNTVQVHEKKDTNQNSNRNNKRNRNNGKQQRNK